MYTGGSCNPYEPSIFVRFARSIAMLESYELVVQFAEGGLVTIEQI
jgi:hypothetical protein